MNPFVKVIAGSTIKEETEKATKQATDKAAVKTSLEIKKASDEATAKAGLKIKQSVDGAVAKAKKEWASEASKEISREVHKKQFVTTTGQRSFQAKEVPTRKNWATLEQLYSNSPGSVQCVDRIKEAVLGSGYAIEPIEGEQGTKQGLKVLKAFFDFPNRDETIEDIIGNGILNYLSYGNWFFEEVKTKKGDKIAEIYNLDVTKIKILVDEEKRQAGVNIIKGYERATETGARVIYRAEEITHIKRPDPNGSVWGKAVLENNEGMLQLLIHALTYNISILKNGGRPPLQLILPEDSNEADAEAVTAWWEKNFTGPENAEKTLVTYKGAEAKPLGITPQDMKYLNLLEFGIRQIAGQFGVPLILIGFPEGTNRATASETRRQFYLSKIFPFRDMISQRITREIIQEGFGISGWRFTFRSAGLEESEATRRDTMAAWGKGLMNWNDARVKIGLLPIEEEWANKYFLLSSKNDMLVELKDAIFDPSKAKKPGNKPSDAPANGEGSPKPGEGADEKPQ